MCAVGFLQSRYCYCNTPLGHRASAFQERLLAPRTLSFSKSQIFWGCQRSEACESFPFGIPPALRTNTSVLSHDDGTLSNPTLSGLFPHRNVCSSQPCVSREQRRLCSGSAQARLRPGSVQLRSAQVCSGLLTQLLTRGPPPLARDPKHVTTIHSQPQQQTRRR